MFCSFRDNLNRRFGRAENQEQPMNGIQYWPFPSTSATFYRPAELQSLPAGPQRNGPLRTQSPIPLARSTPSPQCSSASDVEVVLRRQKNLALSLQTGLRMKRTFFLKLGPPNSISCEELHKEKKLRFGMTSILCIKKGAQTARERYRI